MMPSSWNRALHTIRDITRDMFDRSSQDQFAISICLFGIVHGDGWQVSYLPTFLKLTAVQRRDFL